MPFRTLGLAELAQAQPPCEERRLLEGEPAREARILRQAVGLLPALFAQQPVDLDFLLSPDGFAPVRILHRLRHGQERLEPRLAVPEFCPAPARALVLKLWRVLQRIRDGIDLGGHARPALGERESRIQPRAPVGSHMWQQCPGLGPVRAPLPDQMVRARRVVFRRQSCPELLEDLALQVAGQFRLAPAGMEVLLPSGLVAAREVGARQRDPAFARHGLPAIEPADDLGG